MIRISVLFVEPIRKICTTSSLAAPLCKLFGTYLQSGGLTLVANINFDFKGYYGWLTSEERFVKLFDNFREINYLGM